MIKTIQISFLVLASAATVNAATAFITNNTTKTLASDEGDGALLFGDGAGDTTALTLSADDGGGIINVNTVSVFQSANPNTLGIDSDSLGVSNDKWGNTSQSWTFNFGTNTDLLEFVFNRDKNTNFTLVSSAWVGDTDATGTNWTFTGSTGTFLLDRPNGASSELTTAFDISAAGVSSVTAGTNITLTKANDGSEDGTGLASFTIAVPASVPEPSSAILLGLGGLTLFLRRRK